MNHATTGGISTNGRTRSGGGARKFLISLAPRSVFADVGTHARTQMTYFCLQSMNAKIRQIKVSIEKMFTEMNSRSHSLNHHFIDHLDCFIGVGVLRLRCIAAALRTMRVFRVYPKCVTTFFFSTPTISLSC